MRRIIQKLARRVVRYVVTRQAVLDIGSKTLHYPYRWELFRKFSVKTGYVPVEQCGDEQSEYLEIV